MLSSLLNLAAICLLLSKAEASSQKKRDSNGIPRKLIEGTVSLPGTFYAGTVADLTTDVVGAEINEFDILVGMVTGSSVVYTFDVEMAGTYEVSYGLASGADETQQSTLTMGFLKGRQTCPPIGDEGSLYSESFSSGDWSAPTNYLATSIELEEGDGQEYTLCFQRAAYVDLHYICIGLTCSAMTGTIDASEYIAEPEVALPEISDVCVQETLPLLAEENSCIEVLCMPEYISLGSPFNLIVRYCSSHSRKWELSVNVIDDSVGTFVEDIGTGTVVNYAMVLDDEGTSSPTSAPTSSPTSAPTSSPTSAEDDEYYTANNLTGPDGTECGDYTFEITLDPDVFDKDITYFWKLLMKPVHYELEDETTDVFPNVVAESDYIQLPPFLPSDMASPLGDCPVMATRVFENASKADLVDIIRFPTKPECLTPGEDWSVDVDVHIESIELADLRVNLLTGSGVNLYLGEDDAWLGESNAYEIAENGTEEGDSYWTRFTLEYLGANTQFIEEGDNIYLTAFLVTSGDVFDIEVGWDSLELEYNLLIEQC